MDYLGDIIKTEERAHTVVEEAREEARRIVEEAERAREQDIAEHKQELAKGREAILTRDKEVLTERYKEIMAEALEEQNRQRAHAEEKWNEAVEYTLNTILS